MSYNDIIVQQEFLDTCGVKSQQLILHDFGIEISEEECRQFCMDKGWYIPGQGTFNKYLGNLLIEVGIPCTKKVNANIFDLMKEIVSGHKVIACVDSDELWSDYPLEGPDDNVSDHSLIVAGLDYSDAENPLVIVTDPGTGDESKSYPLAQFMDAWADSNHYIVSTDIPTPKTANEFIQNGLTEFHLPEVAGVDYNTFNNFCDYSHQMDFAQMPNLYNAFNLFPMNPGWQFNDAMAFCNLPPMPDMSFNFGMPGTGMFTPSIPMFDPQQQLEFFNNTMMDIQFNMPKLFPNTNFMPDPMFQFPSFGMPGGSDGFFTI